MVIVHDKDGNNIHVHQYSTLNISLKFSNSIFLITKRHMEKLYSTFSLRIILCPIIPLVTVHPAYM